MSLEPCGESNLNEFNNAHCESQKTMIHEKKNKLIHRIAVRQTPNGGKNALPQISKS